MERTVYYHHTDAGGVVYYGAYLSFLEEARTEFFSEKGIFISQLHNEGFLYAVRKCNVEYKSPARYGENLTFETKIKKITPAQIIFDQRIFEKESHRLIVEAEIALVSLNKDFKPTPLSEDIIKKIS